MPMRSIQPRKSLLSSAPALWARNLLVLSIIFSASHASAAESVTVPPELLAQLQALTLRVQQLEAQVAQQKAAPASPALAEQNDVSDLKQRVKLVERKQQLVDEDLADQK